MSSISRAGMVAAALLLSVTGCATSPGASGDPAPAPAASNAPTAPAAPTAGPTAGPIAGPIATGPEAQAALAELPSPSATEAVLAIATVLETADGPILCVGMVAESAPPQCGGPALLGWDWAAFDHQETGGVRWAQGVAVEGTYDAEAQAFAQTGAPMSAAAITMPAIEVPAGSLDEATTEAVLADLATLQRADVLGSWSEQGTVVLNVIHDDGSVQAAIDAIYGEDVVFVIPALR